MRATPKSLTKRNGAATDTASSPSTYDDHASNNGNKSMHPQSPPPSSASNHHHQDLESGGVMDVISPREKADFNARLEERRKLRRDQRTRRKKLQDKHRSSLKGKGGKKKYLCFRSQLSLVLTVSFIIILSGWIFTFLYLAQNMELQPDGVGGGVKSPLQLKNRIKIAANNIKGAAKGAANNIKDAIQKKIPKPFKKTDAANSPEVETNASSLGAPLLHADEHEVVDMRILNAELPFSDENGGVWTQGFDVQPVELTKEKPLRVFVLPHSHCDPGWIKTFDDYFQSQTKGILSSVISALMQNPKRKFIWAEISYFEWWWREQPETIKADVRGLLQRKQFEFVTGGWVQPDEANTQLYAMEVQLQEGHDFIRETFGEEYIPKYGWSIDPFGYSPTMAYLLKKYGFKGMLIQRVHYAIKKELALHKSLEFMWRQTWDDSSGGDHDIFTHVMPFYSYDVPHTCGPDPSVCCQFDFARVPGRNGKYARCPWHKDAQLIDERNVKERSLLILDQWRKKANLYRTNVVLSPLGDDFRYRTVEEANLQYNNMQKVFDYINANVANVEVSFGTLSDYFETIMRERRFDPPILKGSFFTYADREEDYWSGYFTSRIFDKALDRKLERVLYAATSLGATKEELQEPRRALSLFQHHDGVTGTAKDFVVRDYAKRIDTAIKACQTWMLHHIVSNKDHERSKALARKLQLMACWQASAPRGLSKNLCDHGPDTKIIVYNPLETEQSCGSVVVPGRTTAHAKLPCEIPGPISASKAAEYQQRSAGIQFDPNTGLMTHPIKEEWMVWKVTKGGAYLFFPGRLESYKEMGLKIEDGGTTVITNNWKRTVVERKLPKDENGGGDSIAIDFVYETNLQNRNEEWFARFTSSDIQNQGVFHTDLNGFNFDTHHFRTDMPIQSQVFPMPTLASIEDSKNRMTVLSEHAQGAASLEESAIDVWLDRRLGQDDARGLEEGVMDNVPTRTRLRVVLEKTPEKDGESGEFSITPFCKRQWKELNHPLEMFGAGTPVHVNNHPFGDTAHALGLTSDVDSIELDNRAIKVKQRAEMDPHAMDRDSRVGNHHSIGAVYMVYKRVDYLRQAIDTLRESDYPKELPVIISSDGHNEEIIDYVESIKSELHVIHIFHPFSCSDHPDSFPGNDPKLNENYAGDTYGNERDFKITCCKHHFTWMINEVFALQETLNLDGFLFLEEDYIVAPTFYETLQKGFTYIDTKGRRGEFFGVTLDPTDGYAHHVPHGGPWIERHFVTGPMAFRRDVFAKIKSHAKEFCEFDDYNWDWSLVHLMAKEFIPWQVLVPGTLQTAHIGMKGGMHEGAVTNKKRVRYMNELLKDGKLPAFHEDVGVPVTQRIAPPKDDKGFGGWGHPADQGHCVEVFEADHSLGLAASK